MTIPTFLDSSLKTTVPINGVFLSFSKAIDSLERFCRPVFFHNDDPLYEVSYAGSSFLFRYRNRNLRICTKHQLGSGVSARSPRDLILMINNEEGANYGLTPRESTKVEMHDDSDRTLEDILVTTYEKLVDGPEIQKYFLELNADKIVDLQGLDCGNVIAIFAIGFPRAQSSFESTFDEVFEPISLHVTANYTPLYLEFSEPSAWDQPHRIPMTLHPGYTNGIGDPDGYSGSPVFLVYKDTSAQCHLGFGGMVTDASNDGRFNIYDAKQIFECVNKIVIAAT